MSNNWKKSNSYVSWSGLSKKRGIFSIPWIVKIATFFHYPENFKKVTWFLLNLWPSSNFLTKLTNPIIFVEWPKMYVVWRYLDQRWSFCELPVLAAFPWFLCPISLAGDSRHSNWYFSSLGATQNKQYLWNITKHSVKSFFDVDCAGSSRLLHDFFLLNNLWNVSCQILYTVWSLKWRRTTSND